MFYNPYLLLTNTVLLMSMAWQVDAFLVDPWDQLRRPPLKVKPEEIGTLKLDCIEQDTGRIVDCAGQDSDQDTGTLAVKCSGCSCKNVKIPVTGLWDSYYESVEVCDCPLKPAHNCSRIDSQFTTEKGIYNPRTQKLME